MSINFKKLESIKIINNESYSKEQVIKIIKFIAEAQKADDYHLVGNILIKDKEYPVNNFDVTQVLDELHDLENNVSNKIKFVEIEEYLKESI